MLWKLCYTRHFFIRTNNDQTWPVNGRELVTYNGLDTNGRKTVTAVAMAQVIMLAEGRQAEHRVHADPIPQQ